LEKRSNTSLKTKSHDNKNGSSGAQAQKATKDAQKYFISHERRENISADPINRSKEHNNGPFGDDIRKKHKKSAKGLKQSGRHTFGIS